MRWRDPLDEILGSRAKLRVLRCLWRAEAPLSGRGIARRTGLSHTGVMGSLADLGDAAVVLPVPDAAGPRYRLNRDHELVRGGLGALLEAERQLDDRLGAFILERIPHALSAVLIGSAARGEDRSTSDLDVLIVVPDGFDPEAASDSIMASETLSRFGKLVEPLVWTRSDLLARFRRRLPIVSAIREEARVLAGRPPDELVHEDPRRAG